MSGAIRCAAVGLYFGIKTGLTKSGEQWSAFQFKCDEIYNGITLSGEQLSEPNVLVFNRNIESACDVSSLSVGQKYHLNLGVQSSKTGVNYRLLAYKLVEQK